MSPLGSSLPGPQIGIAALSSLRLTDKSSRWLHSLDAHLSPLPARPHPSIIEGHEQDAGIKDGK